MRFHGWDDAGPACRNASVERFVFAPTFDFCSRFAATQIIV
jgi:hypothetical protein